MCYDGDRAQLLADLSKLFIELGVEASVDHDSHSLQTKMVPVSRDLGLGKMQAFVTISKRGDSPSYVPVAARSKPYRIEVKRLAGDTFQFHAFYRKLRDALRPLIRTTEVSDGSISAPGQRGIGAAGWGSRLECP